MKKKTYNFLTIFIIFIYWISTNVFMLYLGNKIQFISFNIVNSIYLILLISTIILTNIEFKKSNFKENDTPKDFRKKLSESVSNSFILSTFFCIIIVLLLYHFLENILKYLNLKPGIINYTIYSLKIFVVSSPFWGLEITILRYFYEINCYNKITHLSYLKFIIFIILTFILFFKYNTSSILYSKIITDFIFLYFYTKTCFSITVFKQYKKYI